MHFINRKNSRFSHHPAVLIIVRGTTLVIILLAVLLVVGAFYRAPLEKRTEDFFIKEYSSYNDVSGLTREQILDQIPEDEKEILLYIQLLRIPVLEVALVVLMITNGFLLFKYNTKSKSEGVWLDKNQYPEVYNIVKKLSKYAGLKNTPKVFLLTGEGADSTKVACAISARSYIALPMEIVDVCLENKDYNSLAFIVGHELGHHVLGHRTVFHNLIASVIYVFPPLRYTIGNPLFRAKEYSADKVASELSGDKEGRSLLVLTNSTRYSRTFNFKNYLKHHTAKNDFSLVFSNLLKEFPHISWRIKALKNKKHGRIF